jgi:hypothetical protein
MIMNNVLMAKNPDVCDECGARINPEPLGNEHDPLD